MLKHALSLIFSKTPSRQHSLIKNLLLKTNLNMSEPVKRMRSGPITIGTHSGTFHCDEVLACFMLQQLPEYKNSIIIRSRNIPELHEKCDIIVDVGGEFNHKLNRYDHHQKSFNETLSSLRPELGNEFNIRLSSAGLIYTFYGERVIQSILKSNGCDELSEENLRICYLQIYKNFIKEIDAIDNGVPLVEKGIKQAYTINTDISSRISKLNGAWHEVLDNDSITKRFQSAITKIGEEFTDNVFEIGKSWIKAREHVKEALQSAKDIHKSGEILYLKTFVPWKAHLRNLEIELDVVGIPKLVIFSDASSWRIMGVPLSPDSFEGRKFLPTPWRGLANEKLSEVAGIPDMIFVHHTGFVGGAKTKESIFQMAIKSLEYNE